MPHTSSRVITVPFRILSKKNGRNYFRSTEIGTCLVLGVKNEISPCPQIIALLVPFKVFFENFQQSMKLYEFFFSLSYFHDMLSTTYYFFNPDSDQHQISPCNINAYSNPEVTRIKDMITQGECCSYFNNFSTVQVFQREVWGEDRRICSLILGVKGLNRVSFFLIIDTLLGAKTFRISVPFTMVQLWSPTCEPSPMD